MLINSRFLPRFVPPRYIPKLLQRPLWMDPEDDESSPGQPKGSSTADDAPPPSDAEEFPHVNRLEILDALESAHGEYFRLLLKTYPVRPGAPSAPAAEFGPPELCDLAISAQAAAIALGPVAIRRFIHLGFDLLYPFDNPVDLFNWRAHVREHQVDHTLYAAIAIRIESEVKRMRLVLKMNGEREYDALDTGTLLVSAERYDPPAAQAPSVAVPGAADGVAGTVGSDGEAGLLGGGGTAAANPGDAPLAGEAIPPAAQAASPPSHAVDAAAVNALAAQEKATPAFAGSSQVIGTLVHESGVAAAEPSHGIGGGHTGGPAFMPPGAFRI
jgi:hypothetical protein